MKVLQICLRVPFPTRDGGTMAMASLANGLKMAGAKVTIFALNTSKHFVDLKTIPHEHKEYHIKAHYIDNSIHPLNALTNLFSGEAFHVSRFFNDEVNHELESLLKKKRFDLVVFESIFMAPYLVTVRSHSTAICVLRSHNIEFRIWERNLGEMANPVKKAYLKLQMERLKKYELTHTRKFDLVAAITKVDELFYKSHGFSEAVMTLPFGISIDMELEKAYSVQGPLVLGFLGSLDWIPNQEGVRWFLKEIWPEIQSGFPGIICKLAGRHLPDDIRQMANDQLQTLGEIDDVRAFYEGIDLMIVPLRSGSGVRIKVLESMSYGVPVVSTSIGYEGINAVNGVSIFEANEPQEFIAVLHQITEDRSLLKRMADNARDLVARDHDKVRIADKLLRKVEQLKRAQD